MTRDVVAPRSQEFSGRHHLPHVAKHFRLDELIRAVQELLIANQAVEAVRVNAVPKHVSGNG